MAQPPPPDDPVPAPGDAEPHRRFAEVARSLRESEARFRAALAGARTSITIQDRDLRITWSYNPHVGAAPGDLVGLTDEDLFPPETAAEYRRIKQGVLETGSGVRLVASSPLDPETWFDTTIEPFYDDDLNITGLAIVATDVSDFKRTEGEVRAAGEQFRSAFEEAPIGIALVSARPESAGRHLRVNRALCAITGYAEDDLLGRTTDDISDPDDLRDEQELIALLLAGAIPSYRVEKRYRHAAGHKLWVQITSSLIRDAGGQPLHRIAHVEDVSRRRAVESRLRSLAAHDPLTGLANRRLFLERLVDEAARVSRGADSAAVLLVDLDRFKDVNDTYGHAAGDEILKVVAEELTARARETDTVARIGGDEFGVLLPGAGVEEAGEVAQQLTARIRAREVLVAGHAIRTTASVGVARVESGTAGRSADEVLVDADLAMYDAKDRGRDRVSVLAPDRAPHARVRARMTWAQQLRRALEEDRLDLDAQPVRDLRAHGAAAVQHELLLRMRDTDGALMEPVALLAIAERFGMAQAIDSWVGGRAVRLLATHPGLRLEMNVTAASLGDLGLVRLLERELAASGVAPSRLILETSERNALADVASVRVFAEEARVRGIGFALDDFGSGVGSFTNLRNVGFDYLKIDGELVGSQPPSPADRLVVASVVGIAHGLGARVIAESVASEDGLEFVREMGADLGQGFHLGRPEPVDDALNPPE